MNFSAQTVRNILGLGSGLLLLLLLLLDFLYPGLELSGESIRILMLLIGSTVLGDMLLDRLPINISITEEDEESDSS